MKDVAALINDGIDEDTTPTFDYKMSTKANDIEAGKSYEWALDCDKCDILTPMLALRGQESPKIVDIELNPIKPSSGNFCRVVIQSKETAPS